MSIDIEENPGGPSGSGNVTVLGASGFVGSHLARRLRERGISAALPSRGESLAGRDLGTVYYCIGLTSDYRSRPFDTVEAHVCKLSHLLQTCTFDSLVYLSSTKVYLGAGSTDEDAALAASPGNPEEIFALSKLMGESLALNCGRQGIKVARLSNVIGQDFASGNFVFSLIGDALEKGRIVLRSDLDSAKDYIHIDDVVAMLLNIGESGRHRIYNVASGMNTTHRALLASLRAETGCEVEVADGAPRICFPEIRTDRIMQEFPGEPSRIVDYLPALIREYRAWADHGGGQSTS